MRCNLRAVPAEKSQTRGDDGTCKRSRNHRHNSDDVTFQSSHKNDFLKHPKPKALRCTYIRPCCPLSFIKQSYDYTSPPKLFGIARWHPEQKEEVLQYEVDKQRQRLVDSVRDLKNLGSAKEKAWAEKYIYNKNQRQRR